LPCVSATTRTLGPGLPLSRRWTYRACPCWTRGRARYREPAARL
jgi:hypothetical protein